jgi:methylmalonyl-CoA mutase N-terminal domain/subunit
MKVRSMLSQIEKSAKSEKKNLLPDIMSAVRADCTLGEISDALRNVYGEYRVRLAM